MTDMLLDTMLITWHWLQENASVIIAIIALFVAWLSNKIGREHNKLSVLPYLSDFKYILPNPNVISEKSILNTIVFTISNKGLGPCIVTSTKILFRDSEIYAISKDSPVDDSIQSTTKRIAVKYVKSNILRYRMVISANETVNVLEIGYCYNADHIKNINATSAEKMHAEFEYFNIVINYENIYGDKFIYESGGHKGQYT